MSFAKDVLRAIGISELEEAVYGVLLEKAAASLADISKETDASSARIRRALRTLEDKGLASRSANGRTYAAVAPRAALNLLVAKKHEELEEARLAVDYWDERFRHLSPLRESVDVVEMLTGPEGVGNRFLQLQSSANEEVLILDKPPYAYNPALGEPGFLRGLDRQVRFGTIYDRLALEVEGRVADIEFSMGAGEEVAVHPNLPMKLAVFDRRIALVPLARDVSRGVEGTLVVHPSPLLDALVTLWHLLWSQSTPIHSARDLVGEDEVGSEPGVDERIITLLLGGFKAQSIARQLGLGKSTVDRRIANIIKNLNAETRFQAGYRLGYDTATREMGASRAT